MIQVEYFSDVLCVWAYVGELRFKEVEKNLGKDLDIRLHFLNNFASVHQKIKQGWAGKNGFQGYAAHVQEVANQFDVTIHPDTWHSTQPKSSMLPHMVIKAVQLHHTAQQVNEFVSAIREQFFAHGKDVSQMAELKRISEQQSLDWPSIENSIASGEALANLNSDFQLASSYQVSVSPAWVFNEGRQKLIGNVGYGVIAANLKELIVQKPLKQAWC